jgi:hypothetical protein
MKLSKVTDENNLDNLRCFTIIIRWLFKWCLWLQCRNDLSNAKHGLGYKDNNKFSFTTKQHKFGKKLTLILLVTGASWSQVVLLNKKVKPRRRSLKSLIAYLTKININWHVFHGFSFTVRRHKYDFISNDFFMILLVGFYVAITQ